MVSESCSPFSIEENGIPVCSARRVAISLVESVGVLISIGSARAVALFALSARSLLARVEASSNLPSSIACSFSYFITSSDNILSLIN